MNHKNPTAPKTIYLPNSRRYAMQITAYVLLNSFAYERKEIDSGIQSV